MGTRKFTQEKRGWLGSHTCRSTLLLFYERAPSSAFQSLRHHRTPVAVQGDASPGRPLPSTLDPIFLDKIIRMGTFPLLCTYSYIQRGNGSGADLQKKQPQLRHLRQLFKGPAALCRLQQPPPDQRKQRQPPP